MLPKVKRGFEIVKDNFRKNEGDIQLPKRGDKRSAGYDFYSPVDLVIKAGETGFIWTDIKAFMQDDEVLLLYVRSSVGVKHGVVLSNGTGVVDASYFSNANNDGNIGIPLRNLSDKDFVINKGDRIAQGIFMNYLVADDDNVMNEERKGGFGSSGK
jgi:dUTP pyrophosphatase